MVCCFTGSSIFRRKLTLWSSSAEASPWECQVIRFTCCLDHPTAHMMMDHHTTVHRWDLMLANSVIIRCMHYSPATRLFIYRTARGCSRYSSFQLTSRHLKWPSSLALVSSDFYQTDEHMHKWVHSIKIHHECNSCSCEHIYGMQLWCLFSLPPKAFWQDPPLHSHQDPTSVPVKV